MADPTTEMEHLDAPVAGVPPGPGLPAGAIPSSRLAPPLPPPSANRSLLTAALAVLLLAILAVGMVLARRRRHRRSSQCGLRESTLAGLEALRGEPDSRLQANRVRTLLVRFLQGATGWPCNVLTVEELVARLKGYPAAQRPALAAVIAVLRSCDLRRFLPSGNADGSRLPDAAIAAVRLWPEPPVGVAAHPDRVGGRL